jgi:hypothetical protein
MREDSRQILQGEIGVSLMMSGKPATKMTR